MDNVKLRDKSKIGILDLTRVNRASHTVNLRKESEIYKDTTMKQFNKEVTDLSKNARARVSLYIAKAINVFVKRSQDNHKDSILF
jgi:hypothetical protein